MISDFYNLREQPFGVTPDSRYLYMSATHREALASLLYGIEQGRGFVALIARPGMGKTTLLFEALQQLRDKARAVFVFQTVCTPIDFLRVLLSDLGVEKTDGSVVELQSKLNDVLVEQTRSGKPLVIVIDEAQNLDDSVLELVRMLSNFETSREKLLQIVLAGQPQLAEKLASPGLVQLRQRISILACLKPLSAEETALYVDHRVRVAGYSGEKSLFSREALERIAASSEGIPRNINNLCFHALSLGCALKRREIDAEIMNEVVADLDLEPLRKECFVVAPATETEAKKVPAPALAPVATVATRRAKWLPKLAAACVLLLVVAGALFLGHRRTTSKDIVRAADVALSVHAEMAPSVHAVSTTSVPKAQPALPVAPTTSIIRVKRGETLTELCAQRFGTCRPQELREIVQLNPRLVDIDSIESGQRIRVPATKQDSENPQQMRNDPAATGPRKEVHNE